MAVRAPAGHKHIALHCSIAVSIRCIEDHGLFGRIVCSLFVLDIITVRSGLCFSCLCEETERGAYYYSSQAKVRRGDGRPRRHVRRRDLLQLLVRQEAVQLIAVPTRDELV